MPSGSRRGQGLWKRAVGIGKVVSDIGLPDGSGLERLARLRKMRSVADHFIKPVDFDRLIAAIDRLTTPDTRPGRRARPPELGRTREPTQRRLSWKVTRGLQRSVVRVPGRAGTLDVERASRDDGAFTDDGVATLLDRLESLPGRFTTRVFRLTAVGASFSGQHGTVPFPGVRSEGYALGQNSGEILHSVDI